MPNSLINDRTQHLDLPLPNPFNDLADDVLRLVEAFVALDAAVNSRATHDEVAAEFAKVVGSSPELLNTIHELAQALGNDPNFATTVAQAIASKLPLSEVVSSPAAGKLLRLDASGDLPANTASASKLKVARLLIVDGHASGQVPFDGSDDATITLTIPLASTASAGRVELADNTETSAGTDASRAVTPAGLASLRGAAGGLATLNGSGVVGDAQLANTGVTPGDYMVVTLDAKGRGTGGRALAAGDIPMLTASKISDFDTKVRSSRLDQMASPTAAVSMGSQRLTGLADPQSAQDAVTLSFAQSLIQGLAAKASVKAATTANVTLSGLQTVDGVALVAGDRVLVKDQTNAAQNGIYIVASGAWARADDASTWDKLASAYILVQKGTINADVGFLITVDAGAGTLDTTAVTVVKFSGAGQTAVDAGAGLTKTGYQLDVGAGPGIAVGADTVGLAGQALAMHNLATNGFVVRIAVATVAARSMAVSGSGLSLSNADGVAGNPTFSLSAALSSIGGLTPAADRLAYFTGTGSAALATFSAFGRTLAALVDDAAGRTALGAAAADHTHVAVTPVAGSWFQGTPYVANDGTMDIGRHIDFHSSSTEAVDASVRLSASTGILENNGVFRTALGSATSPAYSFSALPSTGMFGTANPSLEFSVSGGKRFSVTTAGVAPGIDNAYTSGQAQLRWSVMYAGTGTINTSDAREKTPVALFSSEEIAASKELVKEVGLYRFLSAVAEKGDGARRHVGMTVQRAIEVMESHGLEPFAYGFICYDSWPEEVIEHPAEYQQVLIPQHMDDFGNLVEARTVQGALISDAWTEVKPAGDRFSFRMDELISFMLRGVDARLSALEDKILA